ncbi:hypothetical protein EMMF5_000806 [Cystobasidiomycetes sp. EMM_F5]
MRNGQFSSIKLFAGSSHPELAYLVSKRLGIPLSDAGTYRKPSGEIGLDLKESVREADVYILKQDKKDKSRAPITAKLIANMLQAAGVDHVICMDLHASQIQGFFDVPVDNVRRMYDRRRESINPLT